MSEEEGSAPPSGYVALPDDAPSTGPASVDEHGIAVDATLLAPPPRVFQATDAVVRLLGDGSGEVEFVFVCSVFGVDDEACVVRMPQVIASGAFQMTESFGRMEREASVYGVVLGRDVTMQAMRAAKRQFHRASVVGVGFSLTLGTVAFHLIVPNAVPRWKAGAQLRVDEIVQPVVQVVTHISVVQAIAVAVRAL